MKKAERFDWMNDMEKDFLELKGGFSARRIQAYLDFDSEELFILTTALNIAGNKYIQSVCLRTQAVRMRNEKISTASDQYFQMSFLCVICKHSQNFLGESFTLFIIYKYS